MGDEGLTTAQLDGETTPWLPHIVAARLAFQTGYVLTLRYEFASQFIALSQFMTNGVRLPYSQVIAKAAPGTKQASRAIPKVVRYTPESRRKRRSWR